MDRSAWSTAGGVVTATCGTNAAAWAVGATAVGSHLPVWPAYAFGGMALCGVYVTIATLARWWPFHRLAMAPAELLDDCIRRGRDARARIIYEKLNEWQTASVAAKWTLRTTNLLHDHYPAVADEFLLASGEREQFSGQALVIRTLAVKIDVLARARQGLG
jgi:hypothetical protein